ncbi:MAG: hypothetical protein BWY04_00721 [candidate division CPR1 bacterium ADurb.Bin160]|uniref:Uncharacterized protein n=1 Tax=candidate division CPR1 bacterium ADurb.Bin160 TaxID=1852826 RepID=A0A1V5ZN33_9BACT|nr:MAG: hypothetical protein BWY04_00721 [candidate division CPR1 bacterium ADurb.Bin160]
MISKYVVNPLKQPIIALSWIFLNISFFFSSSYCAIYSLIAVRRVSSEFFSVQSSLIKSLYLSKRSLFLRKTSLNFLTAYLGNLDKSFSLSKLRLTFPLLEFSNLLATNPFVLLFSKIASELAIFSKDVGRTTNFFSTVLGLSEFMGIAIAISMPKLTVKPLNHSKNHFSLSFNSSHLVCFSWILLNANKYCENCSASTLPSSLFFNSASSFALHFKSGDNQLYNFSSHSNKFLISLKFSSLLSSCP